MIVGDFCLKESPQPEIVFDCHCQNFHLCRHNGSRILQTNYFILQPCKQRVSPLLLVHVNGESERNVIPAMKRHQAITTR